MNLPNKLTIARMFLSLAFLGFLFGHGVGWKVLALVTFVIASLTDMADGYLAKKNNQITDFGRVMDPIADKVLVLSAFLAFVEMRIIPAWMVVVIIFREVAVTGLRLFALSMGKVIPADIGGKHKTVWQMAAIILTLIFLIFREGGERVFAFWTPAVARGYGHLIFSVMLIAVVLTLASGVSFLVKNRGIYANEKKG